MAAGRGGVFKLNVVFFRLAPPFCSSGFGVCCLLFGVEIFSALPLPKGWRKKGSGFGVPGSEFRVQSSEFRVRVKNSPPSEGWPQSGVGFLSDMSGFSALPLPDLVRSSEFRVQSS